MTRMNFSDGLKLDNNERVSTLWESVTPGFALLISKKTKAVAWQDDEHGQRPDVEISLRRPLSLASGTYRS
jgi:hypothetical protein